LPEERDNARNNARCTQARELPRTAWIDNIKTWTGLHVEESVGMTEDRDKCRKYVHGVANPRIEDDKRYCITTRQIFVAPETAVY